MKTYINFLNEWSQRDKINLIKLDETIHVYEDNKILVVIPKTLESACLYGRETNWCYVSNFELDLVKKKEQNEKDTIFGDYIETDIFYIFIMKTENKKYTLRFETGDFIDESGKSYDFSKFISNYTKLKKILISHIKNGTYQKYKHPHIHLDYINNNNNLTNLTNPFI
jgi:hypothetical protein